MKACSCSLYNNNVSLFYAVASTVKSEIARKVYRYVRNQKSWDKNCCSLVSLQVTKGQNPSAKHAQIQEFHQGGDEGGVLAEKTRSSDSFFLLFSSVLKLLDRGVQWLILWRTSS